MGNDKHISRVSMRCHLAPVVQHYPLVLMLILNSNYSFKNGMSIEAVMNENSSFKVSNDINIKCIAAMEILSSQSNVLFVESVCGK